jgi:uncharacterized protein YyaL (SSP411 family)
MVTANRLAGETSPYLLQHAHNPVDWYPWGDEALERARTLDRPIFLSIGYAACHWCHVMERESFEDEEIAAFMNEHFVAIKVDREERPDLDGIYMDAVQAMTGQGGWPLSAFLTPDGRPFYAGTYYPPEPRHGLPAFRQVLAGIAESWAERRSDIVGQAERVTEAISRVARMQGSTEPLTSEVTSAALATLRRAFDTRWGGFGGAPKFPQPMTLEFCLRLAVRGASDALEMVTTTLERMADGGIHDHVGGGFSRYSTDAMWHVPHFEKMLCDNAQLVQLFTRAWQVTRTHRFRSIATETVEYLLREMRHPDGGFFASQDADSERVEGKFFTWTWSELVAIVGEPVATAFGATREGNWEGTNVLWRPPSLEVLAGQPGTPLDGLAGRLDEARTTLFAAREARARPATDDKVLTAWNALAIRALAEAGRAIDEPAYVEAAERCAEFALTNLRDERGRLLRSWRDGVGGPPGYADDHALLAQALLTLHETTSGVRWFEEARTLADELIRLFHDPDRGGFFQTGSDSDPLVVRPKDLYDNAVPSGNSAAAEVLLRLALLTGEATYETAGVSALRLVRDAMAGTPIGFGHALCALDLSVGPVSEVAIVGPSDAAATRALVREVRQVRFLPNAVLAVAATDDAAAYAAITLLQGRTAVGGVPTAYVCERFTCQLPVTHPHQLAAQLSS